MKALILALALAVAGCASTGTGGTTPAQAVFAAKSAYETALTAAVGYERLPRCSDTVRAPCSSTDLVAQIRKADTTAKAALDAAESAARTPLVGATATSRALAAANAALAALQAVVATTGVTQ